MLSTEALLRRKKQYINLSVYFDNLLQSSSVPKKGLIFFIAQQVPGLYFVLKSKPNVKMDSLYFSKRYNRYIRSYKNDSQSGTFSPDLTWSLTTLPWVSPFHNLLHALTSWQLISHAFSQSQTPKKFWRCSHLLPGKISIDSQLNPKRTLSLRVWLHSFSLPWWPLHATKCADLSLLFLFFEMTAITEPKS